MHKEIKLVKKVFEKRNMEISAYFQLLSGFNSSRDALKDIDIEYYKFNSEGSLIKEGETINGKISSTLNGLVYLLLYNLIEGTMHLLIKAIYDEFLVKNIDISKMNTALSQQVGGRFAKKIGKKSLKKIIDKGIPEGIYDILGERKNGEIKYYNFNGNVDHDTIVEVAKSFGFRHSVNGKIRDFNSKKGIFTEIKDARNQLAHGNKSFSKMSDQQHLTQRSIEEMHLIVKIYLGEIINNVDQYLVGKKYLKR